MTTSSATAGLVESFETFLRNYYDSEIKQLAQKYPNEQRSLRVDYMDVYQYDPNLADDLSEKPNKIREAAEEALHLYDLPIDVSLGEAHVRFHNLPDTETHIVGQYSPSTISRRLVSIRGQVEKVSDTKPRLNEGAFECQLCGTITRVPQPGNGDMTEPHECQGCERKGPFRVNFDQSDYTDFQMVRLGTPPEHTDDGTGTNVDVHIEDDLTDSVNPGDRVDFNGVLELSENTSSDSPGLAIYLDGMSVDVQESDFEDVEIDDETEEKIKEIAAGEYGDPYDLLTGSIAPSLHGADVADLKEGVLLSLMGGVREERADGSVDRGDIHLLMMGDPSTGKSTLMESIKKLSPRSVSASGQGASKSGMTAAAVKDDFGDSNEWALEAGAMVVGDGGLVCIDEIDDLSEGVAANLQQAMEQQYVSINKAGINTTLPAQTTVIAAGNPTGGRWDVGLPKGEQIDLPHPVISRFDLIYSLQDVADKEQDRRVIDSKVDAKEANKRGEHGSDTPALAVVDEDNAMDLAKRYIAYAKREVKPMIRDDEVKEALVEGFVEFRYSADEGFSATKRASDALYRLAEASARVRLSDTVGKGDVARARRLLESCFTDVATDPETGDIDVDIIEAGTSHSQEKRINAVVHWIEEYGPITAEEIADRMTEDGWSRSAVEHTIEKLAEKGEVYQPADGDGYVTI